MDFYDVVERRHSVRKFEPSKIDDEAIQRILEAGCLAPTGCNLQNREFIVIRDRKTLEEMHDRIQPDFKNAAAAILLVMDPGPTKFGSFWERDAAACAMSMLLAIVAEGYDSVWIDGTLQRHEDWVKETLAIPDDRRATIILPIGKAAGEPKGPEKTPREDITHYERYGR